MTAGEWIAVSQTVILALTGAVVVWYTYETYKIRKETSRQNNILAEQLRLLRVEKEREAEEQQSMQLPRFNTAGGTYSGTNAKLKFHNAGAPIYDVEIIPEGDITASRHRRSHIPANGKIELEFNWRDRPKPESISFRVEFTDGADQRRAIRVTHQLGKGYARQEVVDPEEKGTNGS